MRASALDKVVTLSGEVVYERNFRLQSSRRFLPNEFICANQVNQKYHIHTIIYYFQLDKTSLEIFQQVEVKFRLELDKCSGKERQVEHHHMSHQDSEIHAEQKGNLERHEASKIEDRVQ